MVEKKKKKTCISNKYTECSAIQDEIRIYSEIVYASMTYGKSVIRFIIVVLISPPMAIRVARKKKLFTFK